MAATSSLQVSFSKLEFKCSSTRVTENQAQSSADSTSKPVLGGVLECGNALPCGCHAMDLSLLLLVLRGYANPWLSLVIVNRRFYNAECVILIWLVESLMRAQFHL